MMKCFTTLRSRISRRATIASPSDDGNHRITVRSSADPRPLSRGKSRWRPSLSIIREDRVAVAEDHQNNVDRKPDKKSNGAILPPSDDYFTNRGKSKRVLIVAPFSFSIF